MARAFFPCTIFNPAAQKAVSHVHFDVCAKRDVDVDSAEGEQIALTIMALVSKRNSQ